MVSRLRFIGSLRNNIRHPGSHSPCCKRDDRGCRRSHRPYDRRAALLPGVAVSLLHAGNIWFVAHSTIWSCTCSGDRDDGRSDCGRSCDGEEPCSKACHVRWSEVRPHYCVLCNYNGSSPEFLYVRHVTSPPATDNSAGGQDRTGLCSACPIIIRGTANKIKKMDIITSWSWKLVLGAFLRPPGWR
jgi:hypothetical protein